MIADGGGGVEQATKCEEPGCPGPPPRGDEEDEAELHELGDGNACANADDLRDPALDDVGLDVGAVEAEV